MCSSDLVSFLHPIPFFLLIPRAPLHGRVSPCSLSLKLPTATSLPSSSAPCRSPSPWPPLSDRARANPRRRWSPLAQHAGELLRSSLLCRATPPRRRSPCARARHPPRCQAPCSAGSALLLRPRPPRRLHSLPAPPSSCGRPLFPRRRRLPSLPARRPRLILLRLPFPKRCLACCLLAACRRPSPCWPGSLLSPSRPISMQPSPRSSRPSWCCRCSLPLCLLLPLLLLPLSSFVLLLLSLFVGGLLCVAATAPRRRRRRPTLLWR